MFRLTARSEGINSEDPGEAADVKGAVTVRQVVDAFPPVTAAEVLAAFGVPPDTPESSRLRTLGRMS